MNGAHSQPLYCSAAKPECIRRRNDARRYHTGVGIVLEKLDEQSERVFCDDGVRIDEPDIFSSLIEGESNADIHAASKADIFGIADKVRFRIGAPSLFKGTVRGSIVEDNDVEKGIIKTKNRAQALGQCGAPVVVQHYDENERKTIHMEDDDVSLFSYEDDFRNKSGAISSMPMPPVAHSVKRYTIIPPESRTGKENEAQKKRKAPMTHEENTILNSPRVSGRYPRNRKARKAVARATVPSVTRETPAAPAKE